MNLRMDETLAHGYKSPSQKARAITEKWFANNMYCPTCSAPHLFSTRGNTPAIDFICERCRSEFQLKAKGGPLGQKLRDAAYGPMVTRISSDRAPHFAFLSYERALWQVRGLLLIPGHFFNLSVIEPCRPLTWSARRAGWVGCNILTGLLPEEGKVFAVKEGLIREPDEVRTQWRHFAWLAQQSVSERGWMTDVLMCVREIGQTRFSLTQVYEKEDQLAARHPQNRNVRPKIRQQLQVLRDHGVLRFLGQGQYEMLYGTG